MRRTSSNTLNPTPQKWLNPQRVLLVLLCLVLGACVEVKQAGRIVGHTTRDVTREIGHGSRDIAKEVGKGAKRVAKSVTEETKETP
jgi:hypothetical protein